jgi:hypothetical protein
VLQASREWRTGTRGLGVRDWERMKSIERCASTYWLVAHPPFHMPHSSILITPLSPRTCTAYHVPGHAEVGCPQPAAIAGYSPMPAGRSVPGPFAYCTAEIEVSSFPTRCRLSASNESRQPAVPRLDHYAFLCSAVDSCHFLGTCSRSARLDLTHSHIALSSYPTRKESAPRRPLRRTGRTPHCCATR